MPKITEEMAKEAEQDQCTGVMVCGGSLGIQTQETHKCPECGHTYTFHKYGGAMVIGGSLEEQVAAQGYCPRCLINTLCEKFGVKLEEV
jgi:predicted RNA-binding Zn-ribbon protein involved in translation (DUF1610 family)